MTKLEWKKVKKAIDILDKIAKDKNMVLHYTEWRDPSKRYLVPPKVYQVGGLEINVGGLGSADAYEDTESLSVWELGVDFIDMKEHIRNDKSSYEEAIDFLINQFIVYSLMEMSNPIFSFKAMISKE